MSTTWQRALTWAPRLLGLLLAAFLTVFAADVFTKGRAFLVTIGALVMHLVPSLLVVSVVGLAWRREWLGGVIAGALAVFYLATKGRTLPWTDAAMIAGPLVIIACLYFLNATLHRHGPPGTATPPA